MSHVRHKATQFSHSVGNLPIYGTAVPYVFSFIASSTDVCVLSYCIVLCCVALTHIDPPCTCIAYIHSTTTSHVLVCILPSLPPCNQGVLSIYVILLTHVHARIDLFHLSCICAYAYMLGFSWMQGNQTLNLCQYHDSGVLTSSNVIHISTCMQA